MVHCMYIMHVTGNYNNTTNLIESIPWIHMQSKFDGGKQKSELIMAGEMCWSSFGKSSDQHEDLKCGRTPLAVKLACCAASWFLLIVIGSV